MGIHPERVKVVVADLQDRTGKAEERWTLSESTLSHRGRWPRHVHKNPFINLGGPWMGPQEAGSGCAQAQVWKFKEFRPRHSSEEPGNDRGAKGVAERGRYE